MPSETIRPQIVSPNHAALLHFSWRPQGTQRRNRAFQAHEVMNLLYTGIDSVLNDTATLQNYGYSRR
jgi:hypothetical protein